MHIYPFGLTDKLFIRIKNIILRYLSHHRIHARVAVIGYPFVIIPFACIADTVYDENSIKKTA